MTLDVIVICIFLLAVIMGYKIGFLNYIVRIASIFTGLLLTFVVINPVHDFAMSSSYGQNEIVYYEEKILQSEYYTEGTDDFEALLVDVGIPGIFATIISSIIIIDSTSSDFALSLATKAAEISMWVKCFVILVLSSSLIIYLVKIFIKKIRSFKFIAIVDGMFGIGISLALSVLCGYTILSIMMVVINAGMFGSFGVFMNTQFNESLGVYKYFYENNFIYAFFDLIF